MKFSGLNNQSVKSNNRSLVLYLLNKHKQLSRKELSSLLSLTPAAVTKICQSLIDDGLVEECGEVSDFGKTGRREILLTLRLRDKLVFGINAEKDSITFSLSNMAGELIKSKTITFETDVNAVARLGREYMDSISFDKSRLTAVGVCVIGSPNEDDFGVWKGDNIVSVFERYFDVPIIVENNVKAFAEGSLIYDDIDSSSVLFLKWGAGIGSSIVVDGKVFSGNDSGVAEIGHYIVNTGGKACRCGRFGCLETEASADAIISSIDTDLTLDKIIFSTDNNIVNIIDEKIDLVSLALTNTATILNAKSIVLFGSMFKNPTVVAKLKKQCLRYNANLTEEMIRPSSLNAISDYIGTTAICAKCCFFEREV